MTRKSEQFNDLSRNIDSLPVMGILETINKIDSEIPAIVKAGLPQLEVLINKAVETLKNGGRIIYMGSGHSGDLCHGDAQETTSTFGVPFDTFRGLHLQLGPDKDWTKFPTIDLGGRNPEEDGQTQFIIDLKSINWTKKDLVIGLSASGGTPVTIAALKWVNENGGTTACIVNNQGSLMAAEAQIEVAMNAGPEAVSGSTRMKSGTVSKMVLNMLSTATMIKMGNVYKGLMVGLNIGYKNELQKFEQRATRIVMDVTGLDEVAATKLLDASDNTTDNGAERSIKVAIVMNGKNCDAAQAKELLKANFGNIHKILD